MKAWQLSEIVVEISVQIVMLTARYGMYSWMFWWNRPP